MAKQVLETFTSATNSGFAVLAKKRGSMNYFGPEIVGSNPATSNPKRVLGQSCCFPGGVGLLCGVPGFAWLVVLFLGSQPKFLLYAPRETCCNRFVGFSILSVGWNNRTAPTPTEAYTSGAPVMKVPLVQNIIRCPLRRERHRDPSL